MGPLGSIGHIIVPLYGPQNEVYENEGPLMFGGIPLILGKPPPPPPYSGDQVPSP